MSGLSAVSAWLSEVDSDGMATSDLGLDIVKGIGQADQLIVQQLTLGKPIPDEDASITVDLTVDLNSAGGDTVIRRGIKLGASDVSSSVSDLVAEVDFEIGPDVSSEFIHTLCST